MQQQNLLIYTFSTNQKDKKNKNRKLTRRKKSIGYIDIKYSDSTETSHRDEMDKDIVF
jgi:hypothetical protein